MENVALKKELADAYTRHLNTYMFTFEILYYKNITTQSNYKIRGSELQLMFVGLLTLFFSWTLHSHLELCLQLIKVGFSRANEEIQAFRRENTDLKKELNELKDMTAQGKRKKPVSLSHVQDETKSVIKGKDYFLSKVSFNSYIVQNYWI